MLITLKKDGKEVLNAIGDEEKPQAFEFNQKVTVTSPLGDTYEANEIVVDATALSEENERLVDENRILKLKIAIVSVAFGLFTLLSFIAYFLK